MKITEKKLRALVRSVVQEAGRMGSPDPEGDSPDLDATADELNRASERAGLLADWMVSPNEPNTVVGFFTPPAGKGNRSQPLGFEIHCVWEAGVGSWTAEAMWDGNELFGEIGMFESAREALHVLADEAFGAVESYEGHPEDADTEVPLAVYKHVEKTLDALSRAPLS